MQETISNPFQQVLDRLNLSAFNPMSCEFPYITRFSYVSSLTDIQHKVSICSRPFSGGYIMSIDQMVDYQATLDDVIHHLNTLP